MPVKRKSIPGVKSFLTLISVLSVLFFFSLICAACLWGLHQIGILTIPAVADKTEGGDIGGGEASLPTHTIPNATAEIPDFGAAAFESLIFTAPFSDSYYVRARVMADGSDGMPVAGTYLIWRFGTRYQINCYGEDDEPLWMITCDGERVQSVDFVEGTNVYDVYSEAYAFATTAPFPSFTASDGFTVGGYTEQDGVCTARLAYPDGVTADEVRLSLATGMLVSFARLRGTEIIWRVEMMDVDMDFPFVEDMFRIS